MFDLFIVIFIYHCNLICFKGKIKQRRKSSQYFQARTNHGIQQHQYCNKYPEYQLLGMMGSAYIFGLAQATQTMPFRKPLIMICFCLFIKESFYYNRVY